MWAPQFSLRRLLWWTAIAAVLAMVAGYSRGGQNWAQGLMVIVLALAASFAAYGGFFLLATLVSGGFSRLVRAVGYRPADTEPHSPFAEHRPPPQMIHPEDPV